MIVKAILFFFIVCFVIWGIIYGIKELSKVPGALKYAVKVIGISIVTATISVLLITIFVSVF